MYKKHSCPACNGDMRILFSGVSRKKIFIRYDGCDQCQKVFETIFNQNTFVNDGLVSSRELSISFSDFMRKNEKRLAAFYGETPVNKKFIKTYCLNCGTELVHLKAHPKKFSDPWHSKEDSFLGCPKCYSIFIDNCYGNHGKRVFVQTYNWYNFINFPRDNL